MRRYRRDKEYNSHNRFYHLISIQAPTPYHHAHCKLVLVDSTISLVGNGNRGTGVGADVGVGPRALDPTERNLVHLIEKQKDYNHCLFDCNSLQEFNKLIT